SLETSGKSIALVGRYSDNNIGILNSKSYVLLNPSIYTLEEETVYDSLVLIVVPSGYYYGDTLANYSIKVHRVTEAIEKEKYDGLLSNNSHFEYDTNPIGEKTFKPRPKSGNEIRIPMNDDLGLELTNKFKSSSNPFSEESFTYYFKGIQLETSETTNCILGYTVNDTSLYFRLYYHLEGYDETKYLDMKASSTNLQFNQITADSTNSVISKLSQETTDSEILNNNAYVQGGTGIVTRIDFPTLKTLLLQNRKFEVIKAELSIQPSAEMDFSYLPSNLYLYLSNKHNDFITQLTDNDGNAVNGSLNKDYIYRENTTYSWDITSYINLIVENPESEYNGLLLLPENYDKEFNHVVIANQQKSKYRTKLKLLILYYE
ncbi:MAG TPA: DUF4270 family protein, partial [Tenuifilaceae bacterium]|nr:DUF4270 family protein [Tenuifilaceae bacterium]